MSEEDVAERLDELETAIQSLRNDYEATRDHVIQPQLEGLDAASDDAREERAELQAQIDALQSQVDRLEATMESLIGLADDQQTSPEKRVADLRHGLIRRAEARPDDQPAKAAMTYKEVQEFFAEIGHGEVKKPECYQAMEDAAEAAGFSEGTKTSRHGNQVTAVRVELDALRQENGSSDSTTRDTPAPGSVAGSSHGGDTITTDVTTD